MDEGLKRRQMQQATKVLWYGGWMDVALGIAALLWGDTLLPPTTPTVFGLSMGTIIGLAFLLFAAPATFALYYFRSRQEAETPPALRSPVEKL
jgi:hypothetical protein